VDDQKAEVFAQGLCLHIEDAENLNQFMLDEKQPYSLINQLKKLLVIISKNLELCFQQLHTLN
jgi:hypothetical protein